MSGQRGARTPLGAAGPGGVTAPGSLCPRSAPRDWTLDPSGDWYYWWISIVALPVLYNCIVLVCRCRGAARGPGGVWGVLASRAPSPAPSPPR